MKKIFKTRLFSIICLVLLIGIITSCEENDTVTSDEVELLSFGPSGVKPGDPISFIGKNLDKVTAVDLTGASVPSSAFTTHTSELIVLKVPVETAEGKVTLKTAAGDIVSKSVLSFEVAAKVTSVTAEAKPGENITIKGEYLNWVKSVHFAKDTTVTKFVSQTLTELVVTVPFGAETGPLVLAAGGTEPLIIETETDLKVTLPTLSKLTPNPVERLKNLTITGTNLDLTKGVLFKGLTSPITQFVSKTATQLVVAVPKEANKGVVTLVAYSGITIESADALKFVGDLPDLAALKYAIYEDALQNSWQNWGWGSKVDFGSTDNVRDGNASAKIDYDGTYGALKFANGKVETATYSEITFSIFATTATNGKILNVSANGAKAFPITLKGGEWVEYKLTKANLGSPATITDLVFQDAGWKGTIYVDHVGLR